jgi:hypothetical protein
MTGVPFRIFVAWPDGTVLCAEAAPGVEEAMDIMTADRMPADAAAQMAVGAAKLGKDPVAFAHHLVELRKAVRNK